MKLPRSGPQYIASCSLPQLNNFSSETIERKQTVKRLCEHTRGQQKSMTYIQRWAYMTIHESGIPRQEEWRWAKHSALHSEKWVEDWHIYPGWMLKDDWQEERDLEEWDGELWNVAHYKWGLTNCRRGRGRSGLVNQRHKLFLELWPIESMVEARFETVRLWKV